jgi:hypothetical protein
MDRRLLFPAIAVTALAQQVSPTTAEAEKAVRARAQKFLQLEQDKNFRGAWALVADDTQDFFFNSWRPEILGFTIDGVEVTDNNTRARVMFKIKRTVPIPGMGSQTFDLPGVSTWKLENGDWYWYVEQTAIDTPFGKLNVAKGATGGPTPSMPGIPNLASLKNQISIDKTAVSLSEAAPVQSVAIMNNMAGPVTVEVQSAGIAGLIVDMDSKQVGSKQKGTLSFSAKPGTKPAGTVGIDVQPVGQHFDVVVSSN